MKNADKRGYFIHMEEEVIANEAYRTVVYTGEHLQVVLMSLRPGEAIGLEVHHDNDQFFRCEDGVGKISINGNSYDISDGDVVVVPAGAEHDVLNVSPDRPLKLYTVYAPPHHKDQAKQQTREESLVSAPEYDGKPTEM